MLAMEALIASVKTIGDFLAFYCILILLFGFFGVQLFKGTFYHCVGQDIRNITNETDCLAANYSWVRNKYNFEDLPQALMSLFVMYSRDGLVNILHDGEDAIGVDQQLVLVYNEWMAFYFLSFMIMNVSLLHVMVETFLEWSPAHGH